VPAAFIFLGGEPIHEVAGSSLGLGFYTFPEIFDQMIGGRFWGFLWFFLLFLAAITSSLSMLQPAIAFIEEALGVGRRVSVTLLMMVTAVGALLVVYFSKDLMALDIMDFWVGQVLIYIMATIIVIVFGWVIGVEKGLAEANRGGHIRIPEKFFGFMIKYVSPMYLLTIFAMFVGQNAPDYIATVAKSEAAKITLAFVGVLIVFLTILVHLASKKWKQQDKELSSWEI
jgi:SNF family Na+-dependent transporter